MLPDERYSVVALAVALVALPPFELRLVLLFLSSSFTPAAACCCLLATAIAFALATALSSLPQSSVYY